MDYLRGNATASAVGLFVICGYLSGYPEGRIEGDVVEALQVLRRAAGSSEESGPVLSASLRIGQGLGIISSPAGTAPLTVDPDLASGFRDTEDPWPWFRGHLLQRVAQHGVQQLEGTGTAPDLVRGLTWLLQRSPLTPFPTAWTGGTEPLVRSLGFEAVSNSEQWRSFQRWALSLGLARRSDHGSAKVLIPDASTAIVDQRSQLPSVARATEWMSALRRRLPVMGDTRLLESLPRGGPTWDELPPAVVFGLLKLERRGLVALEPSDDASDVIALTMGTTSRQVGRISFRSR